MLRALPPDQTHLPPVAPAAPPATGAPQATTGSGPLAQWIEGLAARRLAGLRCSIRGLFRSAAAGCPPSYAMENIEELLCTMLPPLVSIHGTSMSRASCCFCGRCPLLTQLPNRGPPAWPCSLRSASKQLDQDGLSESPPVVPGAPAVLAAKPPAPPVAFSEAFPALAPLALAPPAPAPPHIARPGVPQGGTRAQGSTQGQDSAGATAAGKCLESRGDAEHSAMGRWELPAGPRRCRLACPALLLGFLFCY